MAPSAAELRMDAFEGRDNRRAPPKEKNENAFKKVSDSVSFLNVSELQVRVDGVGATLRHRDAVEVPVRESTRLVREPRQFRDAVVPHRTTKARWPRSSRTSTSTATSS